MDSTEVWKPIPGCEGEYEVSDQGRVRSLDRHVEGMLGMRRGRVLKPQWAGPRGKQYRQVTLRDGHQLKVHLLVLTVFAGPRPDGLQGCHTNGDKSDNRLINLRWDTPGANNRDKRAHGTDHQVRKTHCPRGHAYTPDNIYASDRPHRRCKECARERARSQSAPTNPRSHCRQGHALTGDNVRVNGNARKCRTCENARRRQRYAERTGKS